jgi:hypothetical protein
MRRKNKYKPQSRHYTTEETRERKVIGTKTDWRDERRETRDAICRRSVMSWAAYFIVNTLIDHQSHHRHYHDDEDAIEFLVHQ